MQADEGALSSEGQSLREGHAPEETSDRVRAAAGSQLSASKPLDPSLHMQRPLPLRYLPATTVTAVRSWSRLLGTGAVFGVTCEDAMKAEAVGRSRELLLQSFDTLHCMTMLTGYKSGPQQLFAAGQASEHEECSHSQERYRYIYLYLETSPPP